MANQQKVAARSGLWLELYRLGLLGLAVSLVLALISYAPQDPSWTTWTSKADIHNWMGRAGSLTADICYQLLGIASYLIALLFIFFGVRGFEGFLDEGSKWKVITPFIFIFSFSILVEAVVKSDWLPWQMSHTGGLLGGFLSLGLNYTIGQLGTLLVAFFCFFASSIFIFQWHPLEALKTSLPKLGQLLLSIGEKSWDWVKHLIIKLYCTIRRKPPGAELIQDPSPFSPQKDLLWAKEPGEGSEDSCVDEAAAKSEGRVFKVSPFQMLKSKKSAAKAHRIPKSVRRSQGDYQLPPLELLKEKPKKERRSEQQEWYIEKGNILLNKLKDFGVDGEIVNICPGPVITVYEFKPASGVKIREIANLSDDLTLALSALSVRIVAPIPGKPVVGIEIPSQEPETVLFKDLLLETSFYSNDLKLPILLGRLASGEGVASDLASMPHLLVAGATGTGKSVFINSLIMSLLYRYTPDQLKLILVDPKMVELNHYDGIPHLLLPVVVDSKKAAMALRWLVEEMERRYQLMHDMGVRHVEGYNERVEDYQKSNPNPSEDDEAFDPKALYHGHLPYIAVVIDEYADLMTVAAKDMELSITRLAQKARASGIHLILATQRPSTDVVTGTIKANFTSRISFRVASAVDSKTILDRSGAERLLGSGDMLFYSAGFTTLKRLQGAFISDKEIEAIVTHLKAQGEPEFNDQLIQSVEEADSDDSLDTLIGGDKDAQLYDKAIRLVADKGEASISLIQRHLRIGYNRAAMLMEELEKNGIVAAETNTSKRRTVLVNSL